MSQSSKWKLSDKQLLQKVNIVLHKCGLSTRLQSIEELNENASSVCVGSLEAMLKKRLDGIIRAPSTYEDYIENANVFLSTLSRNLLNIDFSHVSAKKVVNGDRETLSYIFMLLLQLAHIFSHVEARSKSANMPILASRTSESSNLDSQSELRSHSQQPSTDLSMSNSQSASTSDDTSSFSKPRLSVDVEPSKRGRSQRRNRKRRVRSASVRAKRKRSNSRRAVRSTSRLNKNRTSSFRKGRKRSRSRNRRSSSLSSTPRSSSTKPQKRLRNTPRPLKKNPTPMAKAQKHALVFQEMLDSHLKLLNRNSTQDTQRLLRAATREVKSRERSDLRWLEQIESTLQRDIITRTLRRHAKEEKAVNELRASAQKLERQYLRDYYREYKEKFDELRHDLTRKTTSVENYFKDQYALLQEKVEKNRQSDRALNHATRAEMSQIRRDIREKRQQKLREVTNLMSYCQEPRQVRQMRVLMQELTNT